MLVLVVAKHLPLLATQTKVKVTTPVICEVQHFKEEDTSLPHYSKQNQWCTSDQTPTNSSPMVSDDNITVACKTWKLGFTWSRGTSSHILQCRCIFRSWSCSTEDKRMRQSLTASKITLVGKTYIYWPLFWDPHNVLGQLCLWHVPKHRTSGLLD